MSNHSTIHQVVNKSLRSSAAQCSARPDLQLLKEQAHTNHHTAAALLHKYRARPSALAPVLTAAGALVGVAAATAPPRLAATVQAAVTDALEELYDEQLRSLHEDEALVCACVLRGVYGWFVALVGLYWCA